MKSLSVIIPTWDNSQWTIRCLESLRRHTKAKLHIIWIDNGSTDAEHAAALACVRTFDHDLERHDKPLGFGPAVNRGLKFVRDGYTAFLNNDLEVMPGWDEELIAAVDSAPGVAGPVAYGRNPGWTDVKKLPWLGLPAGHEEGEAAARFLREKWSGKAIIIPARPGRAGWRGMLPFFCVLFPTSVVRELGPLDERFTTGYCEDDDYCQRVREAGYTVSLCPGALVYHATGVTMAKVTEDFAVRFKRNQDLFREKWGRPIT